jgi:tripartite-type tricarboxylate transporter receptor subunit TctC
MECCSPPPIAVVHSAGAAVSINDVIAGRIPITFEGLAGMAPGTQGGGIRLLGVASQKRLPNVPDLPAINETIPGVVSSGWIVMMVPAGVPDAIVQKLNKDLRTVTADKEVIERFQQLGTYSCDLTPEQTDDFMRKARRSDFSRPVQTRRAVFLWGRHRRGAARRTSPTARCT